MECYKCGEKESEVQCDCLFVHVSRIQTGRGYDGRDYVKYDETTRVLGVRRIGLCKTCLEEAARTSWNRVVPDFNRAFLAPIAVGVFLSSAGWPRLLSPAFLIGVLLIVVSGIMLLYLNFTRNPTIALENYRKLFSTCSERGQSIAKVSVTAKTVIIPLGDDLYKNEKDFERVNFDLPYSVKGKIYKDIILTGAWKHLPPDVF